MKNSFGNNVIVTLFGESHGPFIGAVIDGLPSGIKIDYGFIGEQLSKRKPIGDISTSRKETDDFKIISGVNNGYTCGSSVCIIIENKDIKPADYDNISLVPRPSHSDYSAYLKYGSYGVLSGGGHFSGRLTAPIVAAGAIALRILQSKGVLIGTHIKQIGNIFDRDFLDYENDISILNKKIFSVLDDEKAFLMKEKIKEVKADNDSVGGMLETAVIGLEGGVGQPFFDTLEGMLSHALFAIPAVKGIEFGGGFSLCGKSGSQANDELLVNDGKIQAKTNNSGGVLGGISNKEPIVFRLAVKPTPTISKEQNSVDLENGKSAKITVTGRHDPCIVHRARVVSDSITALVLLDLLASKYGEEGLKL